MMKVKLFAGCFGFIFALSLLVMNSETAKALNLGTNITIEDRSSNGSSWYGPQEDQEVEPGMVANQSWDLEGFFLNGDKLFIVGGMEFANWSPPDYRTDRRMGDVFFDINGGAQYGPDSDDTDPYGYEYALRLLFPDNDPSPGSNSYAFSYDLYTINSSSETLGVHYSQNIPDSNPWRLKTGTDTADENADHTGTFNYYTGLNNDAVDGLLGGDGRHYAIELSLTGSLAFLNGVQFTSHLTPYCGNDNLMGSASAVPIPGAVILLGSGLIGLAGLRRKIIG